MNFLFILSVFVLGFISGILAFIAWGFSNLKRLEENKKKMLAGLQKQAEEADAKMMSYKDRLVKVQEITQKQLELAGAMDQPSKNASHSKYKNGLGAEIGALEEEKGKILRSIIKDGFDPLVGVAKADGTQVKVKLSEYMTEAGIPLDNDDDFVPNDPTAKRVGKFIVYNGGNNDTTH